MMRRLAIFALAVAFLALGVFGLAPQAQASATPAAATATTLPVTSTTGSPAPNPVSVGPTGITPPAPTVGSGTAVSGGLQSSPGFFNITGHIESAINSWFRDVVTSALNPVLDVMGHTLLSTPDVASESRVVGLWHMTAGIADGSLVLFLLVGAAIVMAHETLQTRTAAKEIVPRVVVAAVAVNASLGIAGLAIGAADALAQALLGQGVGPTQAATVLSQLVLGSLAGGNVFLVLIGGVVAVLALMLLATYIIRLALTVLLVVAAPLALVCHALPQTEGLARLWWRAFSGVLLVQVAQSLVLITALQVFLATGGPQSLGIASSGGLVDLLVSASLCWVLVRIPSWVGRSVFGGSGRRSSGAVRLVRDVVVYRGARSVLSGLGR